MSASIHSLQGQQRGVTLVELMIVLVIVAIVAMVAAPAFQDTIQRNQRLSAVENMGAMIANARTEAVSRATDIALCPSADGATCSGTANWEDGVILFEDNGEGSGVARDGILNGDEELIRVFGAAGGDLQVRSNTNFVNRQAILFDTRGAVFDSGTITVCNEPGATNTMALIINRSGQARLAVDEDATPDDIVNDDGDPPQNVGSC
ncbi:MAG: GspH/FimT family pseudopilin [Pseudomonadota bacterium]